MKIIFFVLYRIIWKIRREIGILAGYYYTKFLLIANSAKYSSDFRSYGIPIVDVEKSGQLTIGRKFSMNNGYNFNRIGRQQPCYFIVGNGAKLEIGDNVGLSGTAIICMNSIKLGNNIKIGGNTVIYDTDFHSLDTSERNNEHENRAKITTKPVIIKDNVFVGAHCTILKGVTINENSIVGACSVISKSIPPNQIWAGNPAKFIKNI